MAFNNPKELVTKMVADPKKPGPAQQGVHVRDWVKKNYPKEYQLEMIKHPMTFEDLKKAWDEDPDNDFYKVASSDGSGFDSAVREEIFNGMVENLGGEYDDYYYKWLGRDNPNSLYSKLRKPSSKGYQSKLAAKYPDRYKQVSQSFKDSFGSNFGDEQLDELARALGVELD